MQTQMINFVIPKELLREADLLAEKESRSRSEILREATRRYIREQKEKEKDFARIKSSAKRINMDEEEAFKLIDEIRDSLPMNQ